MESELVRAAKRLIAAYESAGLEDDRDIHQNPAVVKELRNMKSALCSAGYGLLNMSLAAKYLNISYNTLKQYMSGRPQFTAVRLDHKGRPLFTFESLQEDIRAKVVKKGKTLSGG